MREYDLDSGTYKKICEVLLAEMEKGLDRSSNAQAAVKMLPTYVRALPDGSGILYVKIHSICKLLGTVYLLMIACIMEEIL